MIQPTAHSPADELAVDALAALLADRQQAGDQVLRKFFTAHPQAGQRDRQRIADQVFDCLRNLRLLHWRATQLAASLPGVPLDPHLSGTSAPPLTADTAHAVDSSPAAPMGLAPPMGPATISGSWLFADPGAPDALQPGRRGVRAWAARLLQARTLTPDDAEQALPDAVRHSLPDWLHERFGIALGDRSEAVAQALLQPAALQLRTNTLRTRRRDLLQLLTDAGLEAQAIPELRDGIELTGRPSLETLPAFHAGHFEIQDAASQHLLDFCAPKRGQFVIDLCAGGGGKTLGLAARMRNTGRLLACDTDLIRLDRLTPRLQRAGVTMVTTLGLRGDEDPRLVRYAGRADLVLIDAPCSGTGTLRRSPWIKWNLTPEALDRVVQQQRKLLLQAIRLIRPGGTLVYATCSLLEEENTQALQWLRDNLPAERSLTEEPSVACWLPDRAPTDGFRAFRCTIG